MFESPGQSNLSRLGQTTRFSTDFNPALGLVLDGFSDGRNNDLEDGFDAQFRLLEINAAAFVDPNAWAYVVLTSEDLVAPEVEEAALVYTGTDSNTAWKVGRFFVDYGKQMQSHLEELRTLERPLVLREFLGEELSGTGVQVGHWLPVAESSVLRFSFAAFSSLIGEGHGDEAEEALPAATVPERKDFDELSISARITGMTDIGESAQLQVGVSGRVVPEFAFEVGDLTAEGLANQVWGLDVTYGCNDESGQESFTLGGEFLVFDGDLSAETDDPLAPTLLTVVDDSVSGGFVFSTLR